MAQDENLHDEVQELFDTYKGVIEYFTPDSYQIRTFPCNYLNWLTKLSPREASTFLLVKLGIPIMHVWKLLGYKTRYSCIKTVVKATKVLNNNGIKISSKPVKKLYFKEGKQ